MNTLVDYTVRRRARLALSVLASVGAAHFSQAQVVFNSGTPSSLAGYQAFTIGFPYFGAFEDSGNQWMKNTWMAGRYFQAGVSAMLGDVYIPLTSSQQPVRLQIAQVSGPVGDWSSYSWLGNVVTAAAQHTSWVEFDFSSQNIQLQAGATYLALLGVTQTHGIWTSQQNYWLGTPGQTPDLFFATYAPGFFQPVNAYQEPDYFASATSNYTMGLYVEAQVATVAPLPVGAVPEPSTYGLIGAAVLLAGVAARRRRS